MTPLTSYPHASGPGWVVYCGDARQALREIGKVDCVVTDVPYGIGESNAKNLSRVSAAQPKDYGDYDWDCEKLDPIYFQLMLRVSRNQVIFGGHYYSDLLPPSSGWIVWNKLNGANDFADCELAWTSYPRAVRKIDWLWNGMIRRDREGRFHPTQKPLGVMKWIVENYTEPNALILDPFTGSGSTGVACVELGRRFIGIEKSLDYFNIAVTRLQQAQPPLFTLDAQPPEREYSQLEIADETVEALENESGITQ